MDGGYMLSFMPIGIVAVVLYVGVAIRMGIKRRIPWQRQVLPFVFFVYLLGVIAVTLFPIPVTPTMLNLRRLSSGEPLPYNLVPFKSIRFMIDDPNHLIAFLNLAGNVVLFVPFGFLFPLVLRNLNRASRIIPLGIAATFVVESCQFLVSYTLHILFRSFDVDDMILNTLGVIVGYCLLRWLQMVAEASQGVAHTS